MVLKSAFVENFYPIFPQRLVSDSVTVSRKHFRIHCRPQLVEQTTKLYNFYKLLSSPCSCEAIKTILTLQYLQKFFWAMKVYFWAPPYS